MTGTAAWIQPREAAERLAEQEGVEAVCLFGSRARRDDDSSSDVDLLVLVSEGTPVGQVRLERETALARVKVVTEAQLARLFERRTTFAVHVLREAVVMRDPMRRFSTLAARYSQDDPIKQDGSGLLLRLELYQDLEWCQGLYLYCLADLYSIGRAAMLIGLGRRSQFVFSASEAQRAIARDRADLREPLERIAALKPFYLLAERDVPVSLPFPYRDCHDQATAARDACQTLVAAIE